MGTDIHVIVEKQVKDGSWVRAERLVTNPYYDPIDDPEEPEFKHETWYSGRNYMLFGILANIRIPMSKWGFGNPRGIPKDLSQSTQEELKRWQGDSHSHTHFTLEELTAFDWHTPSISVSGYLNLDGFYEYITTGYPRSYYTEVERAEIVSMCTMKEELDKAFNTLEDQPTLARYATMSEEEVILAKLFAQSITHDFLTPFTTCYPVSKWIHSDGPSGFMATFSLMEMLCESEYGDDQSKVRLIMFFDN